jgi:hypothetical protein
MSTLYILYFIILIAVTGYIIYRVVVSTPDFTDLAPTQISLNSASNILSSDQVKKTIMATAGSTIAGFINLRMGDRTPKMDNSFFPILSVDGTFYLEVSPAPISRAKTSARLRVITDKINGTGEEILNLPEFPLQKWIFVSILRDGRRFDVMYDDKIVGSHRLANYPMIVANPLVLGNASILGSGVHILAAGERYTPSKMISERNSLAFNDGAPQDTKSVFTLPSFTTPTCVPGIPCDTISTPPANRMKAWSTPYA